jgi:hypothetical protein
MSKRALSVSLLTAGLSAGLIAGAVSPAAAQGHPVGGQGNLYFLSGAINESGQAAKIAVFGDTNDVVLYGDWNGDQLDEPMVRRGNTYFVANQSGATEDVFVYGNPDDKVLVGDWDGNGADSLAVVRTEQGSNKFYVKNDNKSSGKADTEFLYGNPGDTLLVGNWDGLSTKKDANGNLMLNTNATDDSGLSKTGTDFATDTIMIQRGNQFFVKNDTNTGVAEYTFFFGDVSDEGNVLVGDWATGYTPENPATSDVEFANPANGNGYDQIAVRRGFNYYQSSELGVAAAAKKNPTTINTFGYGNPNDTVFVASRPGVAKGQLHFSGSSDKITVAAAANGVVYDKNGVPIITGYKGSESTAKNKVIDSVVPAKAPVGATLEAFRRDGSPITVAAGEWATTTGGTTTAGGDYLFDAKGLPLLAVSGSDFTPMTADQLKTKFTTYDAIDQDLDTAATPTGVAATNRPTIATDGLSIASQTAGVVVYDRYGVAYQDSKALWAVTGDGLGVRR